MYIGIDLGGTNIAAGLVTDDGELISKVSVPTLKERPTEEIVKDMAQLAKRLIEDCDCEVSDVKGVGIGCPGTVDSDTGEVVYANNIRMEHYPLSDVFRKYLSLSVTLDNDANCAAMGEYVASGNGANSFLLITLGTGVGGGLVLNSRIFRGFNGVAAEPGHMTLVSGGEQCSCGKRGCWEAYASITALVRDTKRTMENAPDSLMHKIAKEYGKISGRTAFDAAKQGDNAGRRVVDQYARYVADGIVSCENFIQPEVIAIGGGISKEGDYLLDPIREYVAKNRFNKFMSKTKIVTAKLFNDAGIIGAAAIAKQNQKTKPPQV